MSREPQTLDRIHATFDDDNLVANAGLLLPATLIERLGVEAVINTTVRLDGRVGGAAPGRKAMLAGGSHIDHADMLRAGALGFAVSPDSAVAGMSGYCLDYRVGDESKIRTECWKSQQFLVCDDLDAPICLVPG